MIRAVSKQALMSFLVALVVSCFLVGCGNGGGGGGTAATSKTALVTLSSSVKGIVPTGTLITGYDVTLTLPAGVTVLTAKPPEADAGVVTTAGSAVDTLHAAVFTPATKSTPGTIRIQMVSQTGFSAGVIVTINCNIVGSSTAGETDFHQVIFSASGFDTLTSSTVDLTSQLSLTTKAVIN